MGLFAEPAQHCHCLVFEVRAAVPRPAPPGATAALLVVGFCVVHSSTSTVLLCGELLFGKHCHFIALALHSVYLLVVWFTSAELFVPACVIKGCCSPFCFCDCVSEGRACLNKHHTTGHSSLFCEAVVACVVS